MTYLLALFVAGVVSYQNPAAGAADERGRAIPPSSQPVEGGARTTTQASIAGRGATLSSSVLYAAVSQDGVRFDLRVGGGLIAPFAGEPALARLRDGRLVVVFEGLGSDPRGPARLMAMTSPDEGRTWGRAEPIEIRGLDRKDGPPRSPGLAMAPDGSLRLVFECVDEKGGRRLMRAESKDGRRFERAEAVRFDHERDSLSDPALALIEKTWALIGVEPGERGAAAVYVSKGGRPFARAAIEPPLGMRPGCVVAIEGGHRLYGTSREGIVSAVSRTLANRIGASNSGTSPYRAGARNVSGEGWRLDAGVRLAGASSPAVARLKDGRYLMVFARRLDVGRRNTGRRGGGAEVASRRGQSDGGAVGEDGDASGAAGGPPGGVGIAGASETGGAVGSAGAGETGTSGGASGGIGGVGDAGSPMDVGQAAGQQPLEGVAGEATAQDAGFLGVPIPDFQTPVDYHAWMAARHDASAVVDNAYDYYKACMPPRGQRWGEGGWPPLGVGMFNRTDVSFSAAPSFHPFTPWNPADHPEWEADYQAWREVMARYAEAGRHTDYVPPLEYDENAEREERLLVSIVLPDLSSHRMLVKQALSHGWRVGPDGRVDAGAMLSGFEAGLNAAGHLSNGDFMVERLVGIAEKHIVHTNARWALHHGVFDADQIERALETFIATDRPLPGPERWIEGETAACLDIIQYACGPVAQGRKPAVNIERLKEITSYWGQSSEVKPDEFANLDPQETTRSLLNYYEEYLSLSRRGYPEVKARDLDTLVEKHVGQNPLSKQFVPSLSRAYQLEHRTEASRRATQLTYAIHLHKARTGSWPASLDELPERYTESTRTDPFTGQDFRYRLTEQGPVLYSASENGIDDGGRHHLRWGDATEGRDPSEGDDFVFWPPQRR